MGVALVTGGGRGIGRAVCLRLAQEGYQVAVNFYSRKKDAEETAELVRERGGAVITVQADVSQREQVERLVAQTEQQLGNIDVLVNNAGVALNGLFQDMTPAQWEKLLGVNLNGTVYCCQRVLPSMIRRQKGCIINFSSIWGIAGASCEAGYSATKAAVIGLTKALAKEVGPSGIRVNCVAPGAVDTEMNQALSPADKALLCEETPLERMGTPEEIAHAVWFLVQNSFITGQVLSPNGGLVI